MNNLQSETSGSLPCFIKNIGWPWSDLCNFDFLFICSSKMFYRGFFSTGFPTELSMETILYRENIKIPFKFKIAAKFRNCFWIVTNWSNLAEVLWKFCSRKFQTKPLRRYCISAKLQIHLNLLKDLSQNPCMFFTDF